MNLTYDNSYAPNNVYGHACSLVRIYTATAQGIHLDVGCGNGRMAEFIREMGRTYVGVDMDADACNDLECRGVETHPMVLSNEDATFDRLVEIVGGRPLASITILGTLEHVVDPAGIIRALRRIAGPGNTLLVVSVPNLSHTETVVKMLLGHFDYTIDGLFDHSPMINFTDGTLSRMMQQCGFYQVGSKDTTFRAADKTLPFNDDALGQSSSLYQFASYIRTLADDHATTYQLVRAYLPGPTDNKASWFIDPSKMPKRPFLSIVIRTLGTGLDALRDTLTCLAGQSCDDFEVLVVGHKLDLERQIGVEGILFEMPPYLREKTSFLRVEEGNRTVPLNVGYAAAKGRYIVTLDDDDLVFGHYVDTFRVLNEDHPCMLLRAACVSQNFEPSQVAGGPQASMAVSAIEMRYPSEFNYVDHLSDNFTPCMSVAYPREAFHSLRLRFDESLTTAEDWDLMMRAASIFGVASSPEITSIYRRWSGRQSSSAAMHSQEVWNENRLTIVRKLARIPVLLAPGVVATIVSRSEAKSSRSRLRLLQKIQRELKRFARRRLGLKVSFD